ncbi:unnamed protein product [Phytomonas sp. EM1]|nr:unnamed protein product [Phytomonas sp. EM1]|eukprot:CCW62202.1 unnamed protein product [Phytomonas sp. isolate EM1]
MFPCKEGAPGYAKTFAFLGSLFPCYRCNRKYFSDLQWHVTTTTTCTNFCAQRRFLSYNSFSISKMYAMQKKQKKAHEGNLEWDCVGGIRRRKSSLGHRPLQSSIQARKEAEMMFPKTLKSGRPEQLNTRSQQIYFQNPRNAEEFLKQQQIDREYVQRMREAEQGKDVDRRFFSRIKDYRDITDPDPYAAVFGESASTHRLRTAAWQRQFEKENEDVELPYERTNSIARLAPNWFVRYLVNLRDQGGSDHLYFLVALGFLTLTLLGGVIYLFRAPPSKSKPTSEIR